MSAAPHDDDPRGGSLVGRFDQRVDRLFDRLRGHRAADRIFYTASELGDFSLIWHLLAASKGLRMGGDLAETLRIMAIMGAEAGIVNGPVKSLFRRARPVVDAPRPHRLRQPKTSSFPSGHASAATVFVIVAGQGDPLAPLYALTAAVVAGSRIHVRIHHGSDVVGGIVVGAALGLALRALWPAGQALPGGLGS